MEGCQPISGAMGWYHDPYQEGSGRADIPKKWDKTRRLVRMFVSMMEWDK